MQISYKLAFSYPNVFENREVQRWLDNRGSTVYCRDWVKAGRGQGRGFFRVKAGRGQGPGCGQ